MKVEKFCGESGSGNRSLRKPTALTSGVPRSARDGSSLSHDQSAGSILNLMMSACPSVLRLPEHPVLAGEYDGSECFLQPGDYWRQISLQVGLHLNPSQSKHLM